MSTYDYLMSLSPQELAKIRPLKPLLLLPEESQCKELQGEIGNRFNLPAARLVNLPVNFCRSFWSQMLGKPDSELHVLYNSR